MREGNEGKGKSGKGEKWEKMGVEVRRAGREVKGKG